MLRRRFLEPVVTTTVEKLNDLPSDMLRYISLFADTRSTYALSRACKRMNDAIAVNTHTATNHNAFLTQAAHLAHLALRGRNIELEKLLDQAKANGSLAKILQEKIKVTSPCGRILTDITLFQAIHWSLNTHLRGMMLQNEYMTDEMIAEQLREHLPPTPPAYVVQHGRHIDFSAFNHAFKSLNDFIKSVNWSESQANSSDEQQLQLLWLDVIKEMRRLPKHIIEEICRVNRGLLVKGKLPEFKEVDAQHLTSVKGTQFYPKDKDSEFGVTFGVVRAEGAAVIVTANNIRELLTMSKWNGTDHTIAEITAAAILHLGQVRLDEYSSDTSQLLTLEQTLPTKPRT